MSGWPRPAPPRSPIFTATGVVAIWWLVAHNAGAGWVQFVGDLVFGILVVGVVGPAVAVGRARITVREAPTDGVAGLPVELRIAASTRVRIRPVEPPGDETFVGPSQPQMLGDRVTLLPPRRGVHIALSFEVASAAPFALQWWSRRITVPLPHALHVAPRRGRPEPSRPDSRAEEGAIAVRPHTDVGFPRGARPYVPGDPRHRIHWRATAHTGTLMAKDLERPSGQAITVVVELPLDPDEAERVAEGALGTVVELLDRGATVLLDTVEPSGVVSAPVTDRRQAGRRLARAVSRRAVAPGAVSAPTPGPAP